MNQVTPFQFPMQRERRGIALVITLLLLVLLSAFAVAFFTRMSVEQVSASSYADGVTTRQLAESAVGMVESQIREATTVPNGAWASQPGMVRTYAKRGETGTVAGKDAYGYYKLYSSNDMTITDSAKLAAFDPEEEIDKNWAKDRALWTDLNEPVKLKITDPSDSSKEIEVKRYPIIDPNLAAESDTSDETKLSVHNTNDSFKIEGFSIDDKDTTTDNDRGRMPVRWIYVLRDGSLTAPTKSGGDGLKAIWDGGSGAASAVPTKANPIVGRVAFWTDDDTSKVNINTAGGFTSKSIAKLYDRSSDGSYRNFPGSFWDTPRFYTRFDRGGDIDTANFGEPKPDASGKGGGYSLALSQPPANEFQRYPGHPATTSLGLVFNRSLKDDGSVDPATPRLSSQQLYRLLPRLQPGGSEGGTDRLLANNNTSGAFNASDSKLALKAQRLYASVDEFFFAANQLGTRRQDINSFMKTADSTDPRNPIPAMTDDLIGKTDLNEYQGYRFFLTAHSRAPELNLFGRPRVTIWPVWAGSANGVDYSARRNPIDRLMVFCSTLGPKPVTSSSASASAGKLFIFQRWNPYDPYEDANIQRNSDLLKSYLSGSNSKPGLTDLPIPGFTEKASFASKYNGDDKIGSRDQILAEIFDYIRAGVNLKDTYNDKDYMNRTLSAAETATLDRQRYAPRGVVIPAAIKFPQSTISSSRSKEVAGFGRFPTVSEASLVFYHAGYIDRNGQPYFDPRDKNTRGVTHHLMRMFVLLEGYNPMQGYSQTQDTSADDRNTRPDRITYVLEVSQPPTVRVPQLGSNGPQAATFMFPPGLLANEVRYRSGTFTGGGDAGGMESVLHFFGRKFEDPGSGEIPPYPTFDDTQMQPTRVAYTTGEGVYPFQSTNVVRIPVDPRAGDAKYFQFDGFAATLRVRFGSTELQTIRLNFPPSQGTGWPLPTDAYWEDPGGFAWPHSDVYLPNGSSVPAPSSFNTTWQGRGNAEPWASGLVVRKDDQKRCMPEMMKSLAQRIWWINETYRDRGRAYSSTDTRVENGKELSERASRGFRFDNRWRNIIQSGDTVRSLVPAPAENTDLRTIAIMRSKNGDSPAFEPLLPGYYDPDVRHVQVNDHPSRPMGQFAIQSQILRNSSGTPFVFSSTTTVSTNTPNTNSNPGTSASGCSIEPRRRVAGTQIIYEWERRTYGPTGGKLAFGNVASLSAPALVGDYGSRAADLPASQNGRLVNGVTKSYGGPGDFDTGYGDKPDGSLCNKPDEGHLIWRRPIDLGGTRSNDVKISSDWTYYYPYYTGFYTDEPTDTFFSPSRQVPSPVMFGSLLTGPKTGWQTLCFSPNPISLKSSTPQGQAGHPGFDIEPKDHLLLDLFTMPVVEPYAISEPFSTAGKVNLNCEIVPFSYIRRTTALRAALHSVRVTAVPTVMTLNSGTKEVQAKIYKTAALTKNYRLPLDRDETVKGIASIFTDTGRPASERFYKSASQICERFLYPAVMQDAEDAPDKRGPRWNRNESEIRAFWEANNLGGDNTREKPYADLYPRLTTKSNTFTVHMRVQKLRPQNGRTDADFLEWKETEDCIASEYRGEVQIERYLDPQDRRFDPTDNSVAADEKFDVDATVYRPAQTNTRPLDFAYRFRTVSSKRFSPDR